MVFRAGDIKRKREKTVKESIEILSKFHVGLRLIIAYQLRSSIVKQHLEILIKDMVKSK